MENLQKLQECYDVTYSELSKNEVDYIVKNISDMKYKYDMKTEAIFIISQYEFYGQEQEHKIRAWFIHPHALKLGKIIYFYTSYYRLLFCYKIIHG